MKCDKCEGRGKQRVLACPPGKWMDQNCRSCQGTGEITLERRAELSAAEDRRQNRIKRGRTLSKEAAELGITPQALSKLEHPA